MRGDLNIFQGLKKMSRTTVFSHKASLGKDGPTSILFLYIPVSTASMVSYVVYLCHLQKTRLEYSFFKVMLLNVSSNQLMK